ncbi:MAG: glycogen synthase [Clostridiales bacterium]|nr:glycogen synthase [Clostridiales bacterium]
MNDKKLKILFVSAEVSPFAKTGGLADVAGSLPKALAAMGNDVRIVMPRYKSIKAQMNYVTDFPVWMGYKKETCILRETEIEYEDAKGRGSVPVYFTDNYQYYERDSIYCHFDDGERYIFFCKAVLEMLPKLNFQPDIIHCNDWHTGPICMILDEVYRWQPFYTNMSTVFTIHNLEYQGNFSSDILYFLNMEKNVFTPDKTEFYGMFSFMKCGLVYADMLSTVSEMYAKEIQTEQYGEKMQGLLSRRSHDLFGIANGISYEEFNPMIDPWLVKNYGVENYKDKEINKTAIQREMDLPERDVPVIGLVSRLSGQKGLNLVLDKADEMLADDIQFVLLGAGDEYYETRFHALENKYPEKVAIYTGFNGTLAQRIYAGCDMFLMPSRFEPCGLGQLISLRYGTIPIVRATGGLAETVTDYDLDKEKGNGFSFNNFNADDMLDAIRRALRLYRDNPGEWDKLVLRALQQDNSWSRPASKYMDLYYLAEGKRNP